MNRENPGKEGSTAYLVLVCLVAALGGLLFGYDTAVISGAEDFLVDHFNLTPTLEGWATSSALLGCVLGVSFSWVFSDRLGRKKTLILAGLLFLASAIGTAVPREFALVVLFRIVGGVGVGVASMASPMYIAEITPASARGKMVSVNQLAIVSGMLIIYFVNFFISRGDLTPWRTVRSVSVLGGLMPPDGQPWSLLGTIAGADSILKASWNVSVGWRWMFASGILPSALFLALLFLVPESPRWLIEKGKDIKAQRVLTRVAGAAFAEREVNSIRQSVVQERQNQLRLLSPGMGSILAIGIGLAVLQQVSGINAFLYYAPQIFGNLGYQVDAAMLATVAVGVVNLAFTVVAIWTVDLLGRKPLMIAGAAGMGLALVSVGSLFLVGGWFPEWQISPSWKVASVLVYIGCFALSVGPVTWVILSEIFPNRIRGRALSVATFCLWTANFIVSQTFPMINKNSWLLERFHRGFPFFVYAAFCLVLVLVVWQFVPETKGRSLEEIERSWAGVGESSAKPR